MTIEHAVMQICCAKNIQVPVFCTLFWPKNAFVLMCLSMALKYICWCPKNVFDGSTDGSICYQSRKVFDGRPKMYLPVVYDGICGGGWVSSKGLKWCHSSQDLSLPSKLTFDPFANTSSFTHASLSEYLVQYLQSINLIATFI